MNMEQFWSIAARLFFLGAFALLVAAVSERIVNVFGYTLAIGYAPGRLLEFASVLLLFIIAMMLRQIREGRSVA